MNKNELITAKISRQGRRFLMIEMMIALVLVGTCVLPLAQIPMRALQQECKSAYRMQTQRLADLAFAEIKERFYTHEISWKELSRPSNNRAKIHNKMVDVEIDPLGKKKFNIQGFVSSIGKKNNKEEEWRLVTVQIEIEPKEKNPKLFRKKLVEKNGCKYSYKLLVSKTSTIEAPQPNSDPILKVAG